LERGVASVLSLKGKCLKAQRLCLKSRENR
jgi:hypothetical protein